MAVYTTINKSDDYFKAVLYTGTHSSVPTVTVGFKSDLLWLKSRTQTYDHNLLDTTRGGNSKIASNNSNAASTTGDSVTFNATSFQPSGQAINESGQGTNNMISWSWKANGGTTASNTNGTITSTVQANTTAGFSIISYTGNGTNGATIGHGLNETPQIFFPKCLSTTTNWEMYYFPTGGTKQYGYLNLTNAFATWSYTAPTSTTIGLSGSGDSNGNGRTMIGYAFHSVQGYSKIGTFTGNGSTDGPFIYTGFKPAFGIFKRTNTTGNWYLMTGKIGDDGQDGNPLEDRLLANTSDAEGDMGAGYDFLSNGVKITHSGGEINGNGDTFLYMLFAESPFVTSDSVPTTAR